MALHIVYYTNSFKEALIKAVNLGGDAGNFLIFFAKIMTGI